MSDFGDDFADFEDGGADARGGGSNYDSRPTGQQGTNFSSDARGQEGVDFTRGDSGDNGGTSITGNVIKGGQIFGDKTLSRNYDFNSDTYQKYLKDTGRSLQNPYGNTGLFSGIFGAGNVNYNLDATTARNVLDAGFDRYMNFDQQPEYAQSRGFGKLFGSPEGEMTVQGELRAQVPETTTAESLLSSIIPGASFLPTPGTTYVPMGTVDFQPSPDYDPQRDPKVNPDLRSGPFSLLTDALSKGREFISDRLNPLPDAPPSRPRAPVQETREDIIDTRTPKFELENNPNLVADASQYINPMLQLIQDDPLKFNLGDGTIKFTPEGDLKRGPTGGRFEYNLPLQDKDLGLGNLFRMFG